MDAKLDVIWSTLDSLGVAVEVCELPEDIDGEYVHAERLIRLQRCMSTRPYRSTLAHECAHAVYLDYPSPFGPVRAKQEHRAQAWAALMLINLDEYRDAERTHGGNAEAIAVDLRVTTDLVDAYRALLMRTDRATYLHPRLGCGQWSARVDVQR